MKLHFFSILMISATGAWAQAPVVDVNTTDVQTLNTSTGTGGTTSFELQQRLQVLERIVQSRTENQQRMQGQLDVLQEDVDTLQGSIELHTHQLEKVLERQRELYLKIEESLSSFQQQSSAVANQIDPNNTPLSPAGSEDVQQEYQNAVNLILQQQDYDAAIPAFESFLQKNPDSQFTDNAHYWLGQLLYNKQEFSRAKEQFMQVANKFESSTKRADSLLKLGMIAKQANDTSSAQSFFEQVINEYPGSTPARLAEQQL
ncbi:MAG: tol-pal system protein YbgF [Pseudomonadota bacterium]